MSDAREAMIGRIRNALRDVPRSEQADDVSVERSYRTEDHEPLAERLRLFIERVRDYGRGSTSSGRKVWHSPSPKPAPRVA